jgi:hypothetical protein
MRAFESENITRVFEDRAQCITNALERRAPWPKTDAGAEIKAKIKARRLLVCDIAMTFCDVSRSYSSASTLAQNESI